MPDPQTGTPTGADLVVPVGEADHAAGPVEAPLTLVEYGDYECPNCIATFPAVEAVRARYGEGLRFVFRHFPLTSVHPRASVAAQAAEAAGAQGKFWQMHELLYREPGRLADDDLDRMALRLGLEVYRFQNELTTGAWTHRVAQQADGGRRSGVRGTPTFFLNGRRLDASVTTEAALRQALDAAGRGGQAGDGVDR